MPKKLILTDKASLAIAIAERTALGVRLSGTIAATAVVTMLIGVWYLLAFPVILITANEPPLHGFSNDTSNSVQLTWTAPGDDNMVGQAQSYSIRYSSEPLSEAIWATAAEVENPPLPAVSGVTQSMVVPGLAPKTTYYFALKTTDEANNSSAISNIATATTACLESWSCTAWSDCADGAQTRLCTDLNSCGTTAVKPAESQSCTNSVCREDWQCEEWSACASGSQTRTCTDANACSTTIEKPALERFCGTGGPEEGQQETFVVVASNAGSPPAIKVFTKKGELKWQFAPYAATMRCGVNVAVGDLGSDGYDEIVTAPGPACEPLVKVFTVTGSKLNQFYAYAKKFRGGVNVAVGDVDSSGAGDIVTAPAVSGGSNIRIFTYTNGRFIPRIVNFSAYQKNFRGGVNIAIGDVDGNGTKEILTVPARLGGPHVRIFEYRGKRFVPSALGFMAFSSSFRGGVQLGSGIFGASRNATILAAPLSRGGPLVRSFGRRPNGSYTLLNSGFLAFHPSFRGGVSLSTGDFDDDGKDEIVTAVRSGDRAIVRIFRNDGKRLLYEFTAFPASMKNGVNIATGQFLPAK